MIGIYKVTNQITGESYIGQSRDIQRRFMEHRTPRGGHPLLKQAMAQHGKENFTFEVLEECAADELDEREKHWIAVLHPQYNISAGGKGPNGVPVPAEMRKHLSDMNKQYWAQLPEAEKEKIRKRLTGPPKGHPVSEETRQKIRVANTGKKQSVETIERRKATMQAKMAAGWEHDGTKCRKRVRCVETGQVFDSVQAAATEIGAHASSVSSTLRGRQKTCRGFHFEFVV